MNKIIIILFFTIPAFGYAQNDTLQTKLNSIIKEADLLYNYEKVAWNATDLLATKRKLKKNFGGYVIYHSNDTIHASFLNKDADKRIAKYSFTTSNIDEPYNSDFEEKTLSKTENELLDIKIKIINQLDNYEVGFPEGFNPNLVLIKEMNQYKMYIIMGTNESNVIPFGNDYLFISDMNGKITDWKKFHSRLIPARSEMPGMGKITSAIHSHLRTTPYITATDICTFRLYSEYAGIKEFKVYSPAIGKYFNYSIEKNEITVTE